MRRLILHILTTVCLMMGVIVDTIAGTSPFNPNITVAEIEKMTQEEISKISPEMIQDIITGHYPRIKKRTVRKIIHMGLTGDIASVTPAEIQNIVHINITKLSPSFVEGVLSGKFPKLDINSIEEIITAGINGAISGLSIESFKELLKSHIWSLPSEIIQDLFNGKIPGISVSEIVTWATSFDSGSSGSGSSNGGGGTCYFSHPPWSWSCMSSPCDNVLNCVMNKQRETIKNRLKDLVNTIKANTKQTKHQTKIIEQEVLAYRRLLARVKKESLSLKEASYLSKKIKNSESIGNTVDITRKGKE